MFSVLLVFRTDVWRYKNDAWKIIYELSRITDGEWLKRMNQILTLLQAQTGKCNFEKLKQIKQGYE